MSEFLGVEYNFAAFKPNPALAAQFREIVHAGSVAPNFTLPTLDGGNVTLSDLRGQPVVMEFGSIT